VSVPQYPEPQLLTLEVEVEVDGFRLQSYGDIFAFMLRRRCWTTGWSEDLHI
jgi:hypothetical protein